MTVGLGAGGGVVGEVVGVVSTFAPGSVVGLAEGSATT